MMRVKECLWLTFSICIFFIVIIYIFGVRDTKDKMGSLFSSSKPVSAAPSKPVAAPPPKPVPGASSSDLSVADHIQELIVKYPVVVFSKSYCPYSRKAKDIFSKYNLDKNYYVLELDQLPSKADEYQNELGKLTGAKTVPRVFINGKFIGGGDDTSALDKKGDLERLLKEAKAIVDGNL